MASESGKIDPMHQFQVEPLVPLNVGGYDLSFTNSALFMVVVLGGVGQLAGTVYAGLGLGVLNKLLEGWQGAVLAKIMVLAFIVVFIQKRPQGIFALKGRSAE